MVKGVNLIEEVPVYDGFWMPLLYITIGLFIISITIATIYCCNHRWWFCESSRRTIDNILANITILILLYGIVIITPMVVMMTTDVFLKAFKFEGVKGDTVQYKVQVTNECSFIEFQENYNIIEEYDNHMYLIEVKK